MLEEILQDLCELDPQKLTLVGVSGGPDSLCLLDILQKAGYSLVIAHFNHQIRPEADQDAVAVSQLAQEKGLPFIVGSADVRSFSAGQGIPLEEAARVLRYRFLFETARNRSAQAVAVGHTADDQVETVLMHFLRGAGLAGLKGMEYRLLLPMFDKNIPIVRPLLNLWRKDTESYCLEHGLLPHYDSTNTDQAYLRNRLRHSLIPELEEYNSRFKVSVQRTAAALQGDYWLLQEICNEKWDEALVEKGEGWFAFNADRMAAYPAALRRNIIRRGAELLRPTDHDSGFEALERASAFMETPAQRQIDFENGLYLFRESGRIYLAVVEADLPSVQWPQITQPMVIDGSECVLGNGWILLVEKESPAVSEARLITDNWSIWIDADQAAGELSLRPPLPGDRFQPFGMEAGSIKLSDLFVNTKLPRRARKNWPLLCSGDKIAWVAGIRMAHPCRVTEKTTRMIHLVLKKL
jgi:tRNA(Ile)-lysidine synthase